LFPACEHKTERKSWKNCFAVQPPYAAAPSLIAADALLMFPGPILGIAFGPEYAAATVLVVMIAGQMVGILVGHPRYILAMTGQQSIVFS
jgi:O-antigen/teichoic acid export membrane protein